MNLFTVTNVPDVFRTLALGSGSQTLHLKSVAEHFLVHSVPVATVVSCSSHRRAEAEGNVFIWACAGSGCCRCSGLENGGRFHDVAAPRGDLCAGRAPTHKHTGPAGTGVTAGRHRSASYAAKAAKYTD